MILADGSCKVGLESTVLDLSGEKPCILRPGAITAEQISDVLGEDVPYDEGETDKPKSPGMLLKHYAPETKLRLNAIDLKPGEALLAFGSARTKKVLQALHLLLGYPDKTRTLKILLGFFILSTIVDQDLTRDVRVIVPDIGQELEV